MRWFTQREFGYPSCQVMTAFNALRFLGVEFEIEPESAEFETIVDIVLCRHGAALRIERLWRILGLHVDHGPQAVDWVTDRLAAGWPVGLSVFSPDYGLHSVLAVDANETHARLVNWSKTEDASWVPWCDIEVPLYMLRTGTAVAFMRAP